MNTLREDMNLPLRYVERRWLRIPTTLLAFFLIVLPFYVIEGISDAWVEFLKPCLFGEKE